MPTGHESTIPITIKLVKELNPKTIIDVGIGFWKYGLLFREYLWCMNGKILPAESELRIMGIEAEPRYIYHQEAWYDHIYIGDVVTFMLQYQDTPVDELDMVNLVFMADVFEHLTKGDALNVLAFFKERSKAIVIMTPLRFFESHVEGFPTENHRSHWTVQEFNDLGFEAFVENDVLFARWRR